MEERHQEIAEAAAEQKAGGRKRGRGGAAGAAKKAKVDMEALTQVRYTSRQYISGAGAMPHGGGWGGCPEGKCGSCRCVVVL